MSYLGHNQASCQTIEAFRAATPSPAGLLISKQHSRGRSRRVDAGKPLTRLPNRSICGTRISHQPARQEIHEPRPQHMWGLVGLALRARCWDRYKEAHAVLHLQLSVNTSLSFFLHTVCNCLIPSFPSHHFRRERYCERPRGTYLRTTAFRSLGTKQTAHDCSHNSFKMVTITGVETRDVRFPVCSSPRKFRLGRELTSFYRLLSTRRAPML
jgi:hypothetical protein